MNLHNSLAGLFVGLMVGMTGMGGASLMAPILILLFHIKAKYAIGSDLAYAAIAKIFGAWQQQKAQTVNHRLVAWLAVGSIPSSLLGVYLLHTIDKRGGAEAEHLITRLLGAMLVLVAAVLLTRSIPSVEARFQRIRQPEIAHSPVAAVITGAIGGFLVGLTSIGAGTLFGVAMILMFGMKAREMVGTDIYHGCILSAVAAGGHMLAGDVDYPLVASLLIGAIPGVLLGGLASTRMSEKALRPTVGTVLLLTGVRILAPAIA